MPRQHITADRGVYYHPWLGPNGERYLTLVNRAGCRVFDATIPIGQDAGAAESALLQLLERLDPPPRLRIMG